MNSIGSIYGVRLTASEEYRYVGLTEKTVNRRFHQHLRNAANGRKTPFYDWLRKTAVDDLTVDTLETVTSNRDALGLAEIAWIADLSEQGHRLLNLAKGGLGPNGVVWTEAQRHAAALRATGRKIPPRPGAENPFYGKTHTPEQRAAWSISRAGSITGDKNPNFGKFGPDHPAYGRLLSVETRERLSEQKRGELNPNFGKTLSEETRAKISAAQKGISKPKSARSAHTRHHTNKGVQKADCQYCIQDARTVATTQEKDTIE